MAASSSSLFESRLTALELQLGINDVRTVVDPVEGGGETTAAVGAGKSTKKKTRPDDDNDEDLNRRVEALERRYYESATTAAFRNAWKENDQLMQDLHPGNALSHQQQIPMLYRRQEVLACADSLRSDMEQVAQILHFILIGQPGLLGSSSKGGSAAAASGESNKSTTLLLSEQDVTQAPILMVSASTDLTDDQRRQLEALEKTVVDLRERTMRVSARIDRAVEQYQALVQAASEKIVMADEELKRNNL